MKRAKAMMSITVLNVKGLNALMKGRVWSSWIKKQNPVICLLQGIHYRFKNRNKLKMENIYQANSSHKKAGVIVLTSDKIECKIRYMITKGDTS